MAIGYHCGRPESVSHVLLKCRMYREQRRAFFSVLTDLGIRNFSLVGFLGVVENRQQVTGAVVLFLHETGLYQRI